ncbi:hypothetical protein EDD11_003461 [Mortierella claussenii]|nr:hypothetical protein EDD11_003461 [Mortierella claussenii]
MSEFTQPSLSGVRTAIDSRPSVRNLRFLSISASAPIASDPEVELSSSLFSASTAATSSRLPSSPLSIATSAAPSGSVQDVATTAKESLSPTDFQSLFPDILGSSPDTSPQNHFKVIKHGAPWRNNSMKPGTELEETLRKSLYDQDSIETWWPLYEQVASQWRHRPHLASSASSSDCGATALVRVDFLRLVFALRTSSFTSSSMTLSDRVAKLEQLFEDFHAAIDVPKSNVKVYNAFLDTLRFWKMDSALPLWIQRIKSKAMVPTLFSSSSSARSIRESPQEHYHDLMRVLAQTNQMDTLLDCLNELRTGLSIHLQPTIKAYDTVLDAYMTQKDVSSAMRIFQEMRNRGHAPQLTTFNILIRGHLENKDAQATQRVFENLLLTDIRPDIYTFNLLMSGYLSMGEVELVNGFYKGLGEYGLAPNSKTYRILMKTYQQQKQVDQVVDLFCRLKESPRADLHPGPEDYRVLVQALVNSGRMPDALNVLRELKDTVAVPVTTPIYNVFLNHFAREGQVEKARKILDRIISERLYITDGSINPLIKVYLAQRDYDKVEEMTRLMKQHGIQPSRTTFNIMINSAKLSDNLLGGLQLYQRMMEDGVEPDVWTYNTLLDLLVSKLSPEPGSIRRKGDPNAVTQRQIDEYVPQIESLLHDMKTKGIKPDVVTYSKLIHQYVILRDIEQAEMLFHEMVKSGISPNSYIFNTLMNGFTLIGDMDKAVELFRRMPKYGVNADVTTFTTLIKGYANMKQLSCAQDFANSMQHRKPHIKMDQYCFHTLMQLAQKSHEPGLALDFFELMRGRGILPDKVTFTILVNSLSSEFAQNWSDKSRKGDNGRNRNAEAESVTHAIESILEIVQNDHYPLHHSEITTMISAYFRLGRPLAAIEFFKTSYWHSNPKLSTTNCGALFNGLLAPEHGRRYDGIVLNLYSRMLSATREIIRAEEEQSLHLNQAGSDQTFATSRTVSLQRSSSSKTTATSTGKGDVPRDSRSRFKSAPSYDLPVLDHVTFNILFQAFSKRQNWNIVLQIWRDLESMGAENLHPHEMPLEFLGWAAQAYTLTKDPLDDNHKAASGEGRSRSTRSSRTVSASSNSSGESHAEKAEKLLRRLWNEHHWMGAEWSLKIYGYNMFESLMPTYASSASLTVAPATSPATMAAATASMLASASTHAHSTLLLNSYLSDKTRQPVYPVKKPTNLHDKGKSKK